MGTGEACGVAQRKCPGSLWASGAPHLHAPRESPSRSPEPGRDFLVRWHVSRAWGAGTQQVLNQCVWDGGRRGGEGRGTEPSRRLLLEGTFLLGPVSYVLVTVFNGTAGTEPLMDWDRLSAQMAPRCPRPWSRPPCSVGQGQPAARGRDRKSQPRPQPAEYTMFRPPCPRPSPRGSVTSIQGGDLALTGPCGGSSDLYEEPRRPAFQEPSCHSG